MRTTRLVGLAIATGLIAVGLAIGGCAGASGGAPPTTVSSAQMAEDEPAADLTEHHRHHHHGGVTLWVAMTLDSLGLDPAATARVENIQTDLFAKMEPAHAAERALISTVADGIAAGSVDQSKVDAAIAQVAATAGAVPEAVVDDLNQLHAALTPEQRATLVDKVAAHWSVWKTVNSEQEQAGQDSNHDGVVSTSEQGHLERLGKELALSAEQMEKARAAFGTRMSSGGAKFDPAPVEAYIHGLETAFKTDPFDARTLQQGNNANTAVAAWGARRMASFYAALAPVLTPEQRTKLAESLRVSK